MKRQSLLVRLGLTCLAALLSGCGTVATAVAVTSAAVSVTTTAVGLAADGAILVGKGVVKGGELVIDAASSEPATAAPAP